MPAQKGRDLLLKVDQTGTGSFITVAGLRTRSLAFNAATVDITNAESSNQWRELLAGAGMRNARITGNGIFKDGASSALLRDTFFTGTIRNWQVIVPALGTIQGPFQISSLDYAGQYNAEVSFDITLESAGDLLFTAA
jgi:TP901-1 family phage major tail protein